MSASNRYVITYIVKLLRLVDTWLQRTRRGTVKFTSVRLLRILACAGEPRKHRSHTFGLKGTFNSLDSVQTSNSSAYSFTRSGTTKQHMYCSRCTVSVRTDLKFWVKGLLAQMNSWPGPHVNTCAYIRVCFGDVDYQTSKYCKHKPT